MNIECFRIFEASNVEVKMRNCCSINQKRLNRTLKVLKRIQSQCVEANLIRKINVGAFMLQIFLMI